MHVTSGARVLAAWLAACAVAPARAEGPSAEVAAGSLRAAPATDVPASVPRTEAAAARHAPDATAPVAESRPSTPAATPAARAAAAREAARRPPPAVLLVPLGVGVLLPLTLPTAPPRERPRAARMTGAEEGTP